MPIDSSQDTNAGVDSFDTASDVVRRCVQRGVTEFVICAGARNAVLVEVLSQAEKLGACQLWQHFEERSAAFFALGRCASGAMCAVVTTSGTAVAELHAAVIEAYYQGRPLVIISADRPAEFRGTGAPQAMEQRDIFGEHAVSGEIEDWNGLTPFHWNVELEESFEVKAFLLETPVKPWAGPARPRPDVAALARWLRQSWYDGLYVIVGGLEAEEQEEVFHFLDEIKVPVIADATSGLREALAAYIVPDERLVHEFMPRGILRIGDVPSGRLWRDLESNDVEVWSITRTGFSGLARSSNVIHAPAHDVLKALGSVDEVGDALDILSHTSRRFDATENLLDTWLESEPAWMRILSTYACLSESMYLGNSMPIRLWNHFAQWRRPITNISASRGMNGIDGQLSTWLGLSVHQENAWCIVGDLTALYDLTAPYLLEQCEKKGKVLIVINNGGGMIFDRLPRLQAMSEKAQSLMLNQHEISLKDWAAMWQMKYVLLEKSDDIDLLEPSSQVTLVEVKPDAAQTKSFWNLWDALNIKS